MNTLKYFDTCPYYWWKYDCYYYNQISFLFIPFLRVGFAGWCPQLSKLLQLIIIQLTKTLKIWLFSYNRESFDCGKCKTFCGFFCDKDAFREIAVKKPSQSVHKWSNTWAQILRSCTRHCRGSSQRRGIHQQCCSSKRTHLSLTDFTLPRVMNLLCEFCCTRLGSNTATFPSRKVITECAQLLSKRAGKDGNKCLFR